MASMRDLGNIFALAFTGLMRHDAIVPVCCDRDALGDLMTRRDHGRTRAWRDRCSPRWDCHRTPVDAKIGRGGDTSRACLVSPHVRRSAHASPGPGDGGLLHDMPPATRPSVWDPLMHRTVPVM